MSSEQTHEDAKRGVMRRRTNGCLLVAAAGALILLAPSVGGAATTMTGWGTATIDGKIDGSEWRGGARGSFEVALGGGERAAATIYEMNDAKNFYFAFRI